MTIKELFLETKITQKEAMRLEAEQPWISSNGDPGHYMLLSDRWELPGLLIKETCSAHDNATGRLIFRLVPGVLETRDYELPWVYLRSGGTTVSCSNRGRVVGKGDLEFQDQNATERVIGFMDRQGGHFQYARR